MKKIIGLVTLLILTFQSQAGLELKQTYGVWEHYESIDSSTGEKIIIGVSGVSSNGDTTTAALRCTNEGVNILFFRSLMRNEPGYMATAHIDNGEDFGMDVWIKGTTHWVTIPDQHIAATKSGKSLTVVLEGSAKQEIVTVPLNGFAKMYDHLIPSCKA